MFVLLVQHMLMIVLIWSGVVQVKVISSVQAEKSGNTIALNVFARIV